MTSVGITPEFMADYARRTAAGEAMPIALEPPGDVGEDPGWFSAYRDTPDRAGALLAAMFGPAPSQSGPPWTHVHRLPETEEEMTAAPSMPTHTITKDDG